MVKIPIGIYQILGTNARRISRVDSDFNHSDRDDHCKPLNIVLWQTSVENSIVLPKTIRRLDAVVENV